MQYFIFMVLAAAALLGSCGKKSSHGHELPPTLPDNKLPRWEMVDRSELKFSYYVTNNEASFQLIDDGVTGASAVQPWLKLRGAENEPMEFVMMFEPAREDSCRRYQDNKDFSWKGIIFESYPENQIALFKETNRILSSGKQQSIINFLVLKTGGDKCAKLTYYDIDMKGYDHKVSILDRSELSKAILAIAESLRLK